MHFANLQSDYLQFLRYCLSPDDKPVPGCATRIKWADFLRFATKQSIVGVCWQGVMRMGGLDANKPSEDDVLDWMAEAIRIDRQNRKVNAVAVKVNSGFRQRGFEACVLKGQGNAVLYPDPQSRTSGDIDVYVHPLQGKASWKNNEVAIRKIIDFCRGLDPSVRAIYHHVDIPAIDGVPVEVHYRATWMNSPIHNRRLQNTLSSLLSCEDGLKHVSLPGDAGQIVVPGFRFNAIFQLSHILNHLLHDGVGLRQLIDYYYLLKSHECSVEEKAWLNNKLRACGLQRISSAVSWVLTCVLGLPKAYLITAPKDRYAKQLMREMIAGGNFGRYDERLLSRASSSKIIVNIQRVVRDMRMAAYYPSECLWEPWFRVWHWFWRMRYS